MPKQPPQRNAERSVQRYLDANKELQEFLADPNIREVLVELEELVNTRNQNLDDALRALKSEIRTLDQNRLVIEEIGVQKRYKRWYDADFLAKALPAEQADLILTERVVYDLDVARLEQLSRQGEIDNNIVRNAFHEEEESPAALPGSPKPYILPPIPVD